MIKMLEEKQMQEIYEKKMKNDFPPDELKPFSSMVRMREAGLYDGFAYVENNVIKAYWMLVHDQKKEVYLLDYFAVVEGLRGQGCGSKILKEIKESIPKSAVLFIESEDPNQCALLEEKPVRERRVSFYKKNGGRLMEHTAQIFGVPYALFTMGKQKEEAALVQDYIHIYRDVMVRNKKVFITQVKVQK